MIVCAGNQKSTRDRDTVRAHGMNDGSANSAQGGIGRRVITISSQKWVSIMKNANPERRFAQRLVEKASGRFGHSQAAAID